MEFLQLKYFQHGARSGNFTHTAEAFHVPASSVSASIKKLETELGVRLFDRTANRVTLNENGKLFLQTVDTIFQELEDAKVLMTNTAEDLQGKIHMLICTNRRLVTGLISGYRLEHPKVAFQLDFDRSSNLKEYDIIVTDEVIRSPSFDAYDLLREEVRLAVHRQNPLAWRSCVSMSELEGEKFISLPPSYRLRVLMDRLCKEACMVPDIIIECSDTYYIREYLKMNMGVSLVPTVSWKDQLDPSIVLIPINDRIYRTSRVYVNRNASETVRTFAEGLKNYKVVE